MGFKTPIRAPIDWSDVKQPDPEDNENLWALAIVVFAFAVLAARVIYKLGA